MKFHFKMHMKIQKSLNEVFDAVQKPQHISKYFATGGVSAPLEQGQNVILTFNDGGEDFNVPIQVMKVENNELIQFEWAASEGAYDPETNSYPRPGGYNTLVEFKFKQLGGTETLVTVSEGSWTETPSGLEGSYQNCQGWMNMICCLKAYLEYGINLRKGAF